MVGHAVSLALTSRAVVADPQRIELLHDWLHDFRIVAENTTFEVTAIFTLHAKARSGQIRTACVCDSSVDQNRFEVSSRTQDHLHSVDQIGETIVIGAKCWAWFFGVYQTNGDAFVD